ncbi:hypothetical protein NF867_08430 [Solitalea sp. MAHUQ-68]|uniref:DUF3857 domain-containing protein n=1 Tax=Solitalea agri TaxID=2953739 RepID=A0A9X2JCT5_9SPHI|nr:hypothetical protein [Solitalea agri]MCO4292884.1 hypothetical protein [Solitalea agri]
MRRFSLIILLFVIIQPLHAQEKKKLKSVQELNPDTILNFQLDSAILVTGKHGLFVQDFIDQILTDTVFYQGFKKTKDYDFFAENDILTFDKKYRRNAHIYKKIHHEHLNGQYTQKILSKVDSGEVFKSNGKYELYTVQMFSYIFENMNNSEFTGSKPVKGEKGEEGYKDKLKVLIFSPGKPIKGVPFISEKAAIFEPDMRQYYDYKFFSGTYMGNIPVYRFKCIAKPEYRNTSKVMINELTTIFDKRNFQILGRYIDMSYDNFAFSFDVKMNIDMNYIGDDLLPVRISYNGNWDVPFKKKEIAAFNVKHYGYTK